MGFRPHILLTDGEERGGIGARKRKDMAIPNVRYMIELDRKDLWMLYSTTATILNFKTSL